MIFKLKFVFLQNFYVNCKVRKKALKAPVILGKIAHLENEMKFILDS